MLVNEDLILKKVPLPLSHKKMIWVANLMRGKSLDTALSIFKFLPSKGGRIIFKLLTSFNKIIEKNKQKTNDFLIAKVEINRAAIYKRLSFRAKGRCDKIKKRLSSLNCTVSKKAIT